MMKKKTTFMQSQLALYFVSELERPENLWQALNGAMGKFDQTPLILPVPHEPTLAEVPIVQVVSKNKSFRLNISRKRLDFFIYGQGRSATFQQSREILLSSANILVRETQKIIQIKWVGFIVNFFLEERNPEEKISHLIDERIKSLHQGEALEAIVDYIAQVRGLDKKINNHTHLQAGSAKFKDVTDEYKGIVISRDFNTKPEENGAGFIDEAFIQAFLQLSEQHLKLDEVTHLL